MSAKKHSKDALIEDKVKCVRYWWKYRVEMITVSTCPYTNMMSSLKLPLNLLLLNKYRKIDIIFYYILYVDISAKAVNKNDTREVI